MTKLVAKVKAALVAKVKAAFPLRAEFYFYASFLFLASGLDGILRVGLPLWSLVASAACALMFVFRSYADAQRARKATPAANLSAVGPRSADVDRLPVPARRAAPGTPTS